MSLTYDVEIRYLESGNLGGKVGSIGAKVKDLKGEFSGLGSAISDSLSGGLDAISSVAKGLLGLVAVGATAAGALGASIVSMNGKLEETQISLASIFQGAGSTSSFGQGMAVASSQMEKMKKDAAALPGEFTDLMGIFQTISTNALASGMTVDATRQMAALSMAAGAIKGVPMRIVGREMAGLLEGRAGAHNLIGLRLGLMGGKATEFNHLSEEKRAAKLQQLLQKAVSPEALDAFQHSFIGLFSTAKQNVKTIGAAFGEPLFNSVKTSLSHLNDWYSANEPKIDAYAHYLGTKVAHAWEYGMGVIEKYGPSVWEFSLRAIERMEDGWRKIEPIVANVGNHIKRFLDDPKAIDKLEKFAMMGLAMKVGLPMAAPLAKWGMGAAMEGMGGEGAALAALAPAALPVAAALAVLGAAVYGAVEVMNQNTEAGWAANSMWIDTKNNLSEGATNVQGAFATFSDNLMNVVDPALQNLGMSALGAASGLSWIFKKASEHLPEAALALGPVGVPLAALMTNWQGTGRMDPHHRMLDPNVRGKLDEGGGDKLKSDLKVPHNVTNIGKVEIYVNSTQDPSRVARATVEELAKIKKSPKSGFIPKWLGGKD